MIPHRCGAALDHPAIRHGFFGRQGGASNGDYASLNIGRGSGDDMAHIAENRRRIAEALGSTQPDILTCHQIHSSNVHLLDHQLLASPTEALQQQAVEADAVVTNIPGLAIGVLTADCVPILLADCTHGVIGAVHSGWKGAAQHIASEAVDAMERLGAQRSHIHAAIGPAISQFSYEVGRDLRGPFAAAGSQYNQYFATGKDAEHHFFDLPGLVADQCRALGIAKVEKLDYDTYAHEHDYFSFRRSTHAGKTAYGRQCSAIMLTPTQP